MAGHNAKIEIKQMLLNEGAWNFINQMQVYSAREFIAAVGERNITPKLKLMLLEYVDQLQAYLDQRIVIFKT